MSEDEIICNNCGKPNKKDSKYCIDCGAFIEGPTQAYPPDTGKISDITSISPPTKTKKKLKFPYKILIFFGVVAFVNVILSYIVMMGFGLTPDSYFPIFGGMFLLSMLMVGIFWGAYAVGGADAIEGIGYCGAFVVAGILVGIAIPVWIFFALAPLVGAIFTAIGQAISNAINNFLSAIFEAIEIPGFEPFLFIGLFMVLSIIIIYKYHLHTKKK